ncbi:MAG: AraC family transcriptional regulator [Leptospiraceae bacterium]|nr:AraC family transcriptional regulator [Leptospiraceae bacterium]
MIQFISIAAITQCLLLGFYFTINRNKYASAIYQAILLLLTGLGIWIGSLYASHRILDFPFLARVGFLLLSLTGGLVYLATRTILEKSNRIQKKDALFFIVPVGVLIYLLPFYFSDLESKLIYLKEDLISVHTDCLVISFITTINNFIALVFSVRLLKSYYNTKPKQIFNYNLLLAIITIPMVVSLLDKNFLNSGLFSFFVSILVIIRSYSLLYTFNTSEKQNLFFYSEEKYEKSKLNLNELKVLGDKVQTYFEKEKPFLNPDFSLKEISTALEISPAKLSQIFTEYFQKSFYQTVNEYRVTEVIAALRDSKKNNENLLQIAFASGFNSKSTFNDAFKKITGKTPSQYKKVQSN